MLWLWHLQEHRHLRVRGAFDDNDKRHATNDWALKGGYPTTRCELSVAVDWIDGGCGLLCCGGWVV